MESKTADRAQQGNTLAGLHADHILFILDESGGIPDAVMATAEAALSSCIEGHIVQAGNPTHLEGPLWRACTTERALWHVTEITADPDDPRRSTRVKAEWAREQIEKYGARQSLGAGERVRQVPAGLAQHADRSRRMPRGDRRGSTGPEDIAACRRACWASTWRASATMPR